MDEILKSAALMFVLLNPFLLIIYLTDIVKKLPQKEFNQVLLRASLIASSVFCVFAVLGDAIFVRFMQVQFASFQIFGGVIFFLIGLQFVFRGPTAIEILQGKSQHLAGAIAMPVFIGPGSISAAVIIGKKHDPLVACMIVVCMVFFCAITLALLKKLHDVILPKKEAIVDRYIEIAGRVTALIVGTISVDMIMRGLSTWISRF